MTMMNKSLIDTICIGLPTIDRPIPEKLEKELSITPFPVFRTYGLTQWMARTKLVTEMYEKGFEYIFFIDSDMSPNIDLTATIEKFYSYDLPVISALTSSRGPMHQLLLFKKHPQISYPSLYENLYKKDSIIKVYAIGFGACLIKKEVFEQIDMPWFKTDWDYLIPETKEFRAVGGTNMGADFWFSMRCNQENIPLHLDCGTIMHHKELNKACYFVNQEYPDEDKIAEANKLYNMAVS